MIDILAEKHNQWHWNNMPIYWPICSGYHWACHTHCSEQVHVYNMHEWMIIQYNDALWCYAIHALIFIETNLEHVEGFQQPRVTYTKATITIKWSPPWSHPVNNYTVTVTNRSDFVQTVYDIDKGNSVWTAIFELNRNWVSMN